MARILAISSLVARGHVGLSIVVPALQALGHDVIALPTVVLSNHPGHPHVAGTQIDPTVLTKMLDALEANGWLADVDAVLTGYLPTPEHAAFAAMAVRRVKALVRARAVTFLCDPVIGDDPKGLYIDSAAAEAIRDTLVPMANIATPNRFELAWLTRQPVTNPSEALRAMSTLTPPTCLATSIPDGARHIANLLVTAEARSSCRVSLRSHVPHGTGDLLSALFLHHTLSAPETNPLARSVGQLQSAIQNAAGNDELILSGPSNKWASARPWPISSPIPIAN
jgi:pyridoxine kinase